MGMIDQMKQAMQMRKDAKRIQAEVEKISFTYENGGISCTAKGDLSITALAITSEDPIKELVAGKKERFETMLKTVVNAALKGAKDKSQEMMQTMMKGEDSPMSKLMK